MSRTCELTGKKPMVGHKVSHSNIKTKRRYLPNLVNVTVHSDALGQSYSRARFGGRPAHRRQARRARRVSWPRRRTKNSRPRC